jgi:(E)-4-hydroxy-3-methylbut-2-enyl-diphosphate synthase
LSTKNLKDPAVLSDVGYLYSPILDKYSMGEQSVDFVYLADQLPSFTLPGNLKQLYQYPTWKKLTSKANCHPLYSLQEYLTAGEKCPALNLVELSLADMHSDAFQQIPLDKTLVFVLTSSAENAMQEQRQAFFLLEEIGIQVPVIIKKIYPNLTENEFQLYAATDAGALLLDGFGDGIWVHAPQLSPKLLLSTSFGILQATRCRISKTEYISCPSCGRTLFDLQETTQLIRSRTDHLKGIKIAIMGCIVNGPGEMADADYGYVGTGPGKITLYRGKEVVKKNVNTEKALDELIEIIREDGNWVELAL